MLAKIIPAKQRKTFKTIFREASMYWDSLSKLKVSNVKVENVVNPPHNPIVKNNFNCGEINSFASSPNMINPNNKLPKKFTDKVP